MMSSEEETEFGLYTDKLLKKAKRTRQRVDAGEPRNSYSSIPNFSSRPTFLGNSNNLYGAIFTQQQHFGLFGPGFAPTKMLNELLGRQKPESAEGEEVKFECNPSVIRCENSPPPGEQLAHHMLRDILQGRKHELLALEHELRNGQDHIPNNNNNNNNNEPKAADAERGDVEAAAAMQECLAEAGVGDRQQAELMEEALTGMETDSLPSPKAEPQSPAKPEDAKKARVENIVSGMRASPAPPQVNGCKKRKLYQPQQHDSAAERYLDEEEEEEPLRQKRVVKDALKSQLRTMQEQLVEMQQKYAQLCTQVEQGSDSQEVDDIPSDSEEGKRSAPPSPVRQAPTPTPTPTPTPQPQPTLAQQVSKLKIGPQHPPFHNGLLHEHQMSNAAAMYLGVSHKLFLEQEARMAKEAAVAAAVAESHHNHSQPPPPKIDNIAERLNMIRNITPTGTDLEGLADMLKHEISASLSTLIDTIVTRFVQQRRFKQSEASAAAELLNKDLLMASQLLDRKSPRTKVADSRHPSHQQNHHPHPQQQQQHPQHQQQGPMPPQNNQMVNGHGNYPPMMPMHMNNIQKPSDLHIRPPMFQPPKPPGINPAALYGMNQHPFCVSKQENPEQNEALSLVVTPKKKRHKVTDTRITPRTVSRILAQDGMGMSPASQEQNHCTSPRPPTYHQPPPPMLPVSLPTSVAIPNPGLHESQVFSPYSPFFHGPSHGHHIAMQASSSPPGMHKMERDSPPLHHPPTLLHPALLAAAHGGSPDYNHLRAPSGGLNMDTGDRSSDCNSGDISYDGIQPTISFLYEKMLTNQIRYKKKPVLLP